MRTGDGDGMGAMPVGAWSVADRTWSAKALNVRLSDLFRAELCGPRRRLRNGDGEGDGDGMRTGNEDEMGPGCTQVDK